MAQVSDGQGGSPGAAGTDLVQAARLSDQVPRHPGRAWRGDGLPFAILGLYLLVTAPCNFFLPVYLSETLGFSGTQVGLIFSLQAATGVLAVRRQLRPPGAAPTSLGL